MRCPINNHITELEQQLNSFSYDTRTAALHQLVTLAQQGEIVLPTPSDVVNMHCHTFFSYNAYGHSPTSLAWLARRRGFLAVGTVDFDVLDAVDEFLAACDLVGVRGSAGIETRIFIPAFSTREINSPGEPGVYYHMGIGFTQSDVPDHVAPILTDMRARAERRNRDVMTRVNAYLDPVTIDYERDVLPLAPAGNATERHMLMAYVSAAAAWAARQGDPDQAVAFWSAKLGLTPAQMAATMADGPKFTNLIRSKLMKRGGVGYVQPGQASFPTLEEYHTLIEACEALPCATWLDGTLAGEEKIDELLGLLISKGAAALNIIPDRNWNIADPATREIKVRKLHEVVQVAADLDLPLNIGTEMNSPGNKLVDDFDAPELAPVRDAFIEGAHFIYGHTAIQRALRLGYQSAWAKAHLPTRRQRNTFYAVVGRRVKPGSAGLQQLRNLSAALSPADLLARIGV